MKALLSRLELVAWLLVIVVGCWYLPALVHKIDPYSQASSELDRLIRMCGIQMGAALLWAWFKPIHPLTSGWQWERQGLVLSLAGTLLSVPISLVATLAIGKIVIWWLVLLALTMPCLAVSSALRLHDRPRQQPLERDPFTH